MARIEGGQKFRNRLQGSKESIEQAMGEVVFVGAGLIQTAARLSITKGAVSGKKHAPSVAPNPPLNDTGQLATEIITEKTGPLTAEVSSNAPYALAQEFGYAPNNLPERPYMRPAADAERDRINKLAARAVKISLRGQ